MAKDKSGSKSDDNIHSGHRERMKEQFFENGLHQFNEHQILELALFYAKPRIDTNEIAHRLLNECGPTVSNVLDSSRSKLMKVEGVGKSTVTFLSFMKEFSSYYVKSKQLSVGRYFKDELEGIIRYFEALFLKVVKEEIHAVAVTKDYKLIKEAKIADGTFGEANFPMRRLVEFAIENNSEHVIIAHNHPDGAPLASKDDFCATRELVDTFHKLDIEVVDHIIVGKSGSQSMRSSIYCGKIWAQQC